MSKLLRSKVLEVANKLKQLKEEDEVAFVRFVKTHGQAQCPDHVIEMVESCFDLLDDAEAFELSNILIEAAS